jgi:hypothetical protein
MTLDILRMDVSKELLRKMAKEERALFLALGHASNQVNALWKFVIILTNGDKDDPVNQRLEVSLIRIRYIMEYLYPQELQTLVGKSCHSNSTQARTGRYPAAAKPPSTLRIWPVTKLAFLSSIRNSAAPAISSGDA